MRSFRHILLLLVVLLAVLPAQAQIREGRVAYDGSYEGQVVTEGEFNVIGLVGEAGDVVTITVTAPASATLDPLFYVIYGDLLIAYNDDAEDPNLGNFNAQIKDFVLPHTGTYDIYVGGYSGVGNFTLSVESVGSIQAIDAYSLSYGDTLTGTFELNNNFYLSQFEGSAGDDISIQMFADDIAVLDTQFYIYDDEYFPLVVIDDVSDSDYDAILDSYVLPYTGTYYILSTRFEGAGSFSMTLNSASNPSTGSTSTTPSTSSGSELAYGGFATGFIDSSTPEVRYTFSGTAGDSVTISMIAESGVDLDSYLRLLDEGQSMVAENDDAADASLGRFNSQILDFVLPSTGTYTIVATRFSGSGNFTVSLDN